MMRTAFLFVLSALVLPVISTSASAQDAIDPEAGDTSADAAATGDVSADASATPAADSAAAGDSGSKPISVGLLLGYGISFESGPNALGFGFGARGGYNFDKLYLGARFNFYLGEDPVNIWELGIEGGYDVSLGDKLTLRPEIGLGLASVTVDLGPFGSASDSEFYIAPGASLLYDVTDSVFVGLDVRLLLVLSDPMFKGLPILATGGMRF
jgi:opacity protein-like surface antigen